MLISFMVTMAIINAAVWLMYRQQAKRQELKPMSRVRQLSYHACLSELRRVQRLNQEQQAKLNNAYAYVDELQQRAEKYRQVMLTEALSNKMTTKPAIKVYPIQRSGAHWVIETHLN